MIIKTHRSTLISIPFGALMRIQLANHLFCLSQQRGRWKILFREGTSNWHPQFNNPTIYTPIGSTIYSFPLSCDTPNNQSSSSDPTLSCVADQSSSSSSHPSISTCQANDS
eukprot:TRINITY_DN6998_c2_g1_i1.p1 TRINITY_DN6998_c2_g1~~TRINITY_DN6998_c2_g1_i1.p1  ORF type:complete len:111 (+),score=10.23 TRINITY_DN6998_c2_g1_i1:1110-1442(+)